MPFYHSSTHSHTPHHRHTHSPLAGESEKRGESERCVEKLPTFWLNFVANGVGRKCKPSRRHKRGPRVSIKVAESFQPLVLEMIHCWMRLKLEK